MQSNRDVTPHKYVFSRPNILLVLIPAPHILYDFFPLFCTYSSLLGYYFRKYDTDLPRHICCVATYVKISSLEEEGVNLG